MKCVTFKFLVLILIFLITFCGYQILYTKVCIYNFSKAKKKFFRKFMEKK